MGNAWGDASVTVESESWCGRMVKSICGMCVGVVVFMGCIALLGWNEFNYVNNTQLFMYVKDHVRENFGCAPNPALDGQGVHSNCIIKNIPDLAQWQPMANWPEMIDDMRRPWVQASSELYQWTEDKHCTTITIHGHKTSTCKYTQSKAWVSSWQDSERFHCNKPCYGPYGEPVINPPEFTIPASLQTTVYPEEFSVKLGSQAGSAYVGANTELVKQMSDGVPLHVVPDNIRNWAVPGAFVSLEGDYVYYSRAGPRTNIGNIRTKFSASGSRLGNPVTVVAELRSGNFVPWDTHKPGSMNPVNWLEPDKFGDLSLQDMCDLKQDENVAMTWGLRLGGWIGMFVGLLLITAPVALAPEILPCGGLISEVVGCALCCMDLLVSLACALLVAGAAWSLARPAVGIPMLLGACCCVGGALAVGKKNQRGGSRVVQQGQRELMLHNQYPQPSQPQMSPAAGGAGMAQTMMLVQCPAGVGPGSQVQVQTPDGRSVFVIVPPGVQPGMQFQVPI